MYLSYQYAHHVSRDAEALLSVRLEDLLRDGTIEATPITYEDFLPLSAAGIFQSNTGGSPDGNDGGSAVSKGGPDLEGMEEAMRAKIIDSDDMYKAMEQASIDDCARVLGVKIFS